MLIGRKRYSLCHISSKKNLKVCSQIIRLMMSLIVAKGHPIVLKKFLGGNISIESMVIYDRILGYGKDFDQKLDDPVWKTVSRRVRKYSPFLNIDVFRYKKY